MVLNLVYITSSVLVFSPLFVYLFSIKIKYSKKTIVHLAILFIIFLVFSMSALELYSRVLNYLFALFLFPFYCLIIFQTPRLIKLRSIRYSFSVLFSIPIIFGILFSISSFLMPLVSIVSINDSINIEQRMELENNYLIEESNWGWVSSSGKEYRLYKVIMPNLLKYEIDQWRESDYNFNYTSIRIDTTGWSKYKKVKIIDKNNIIQVLE